MIEIEFTDMDGNDRPLDLDSVVDIARGASQKKEGWKALVVYDPSSARFIELRDSPPDARGNSLDEAEEVSIEYVIGAFPVSPADIKMIKRSTAEWRFIDVPK